MLSLRVAATLKNRCCNFSVLRIFESKSAIVCSNVMHFTSLYNMTSRGSRCLCCYCSFLRDLIELISHVAHLFSQSINPASKTSYSSPVSLESIYSTPSKSQHYGTRRHGYPLAKEQREQPHGVFEVRSQGQGHYSTRSTAWRHTRNFQSCSTARSLWIVSWQADTQQCNQKPDTPFNSLNIRQQVEKSSEKPSATFIPSTSYRHYAHSRVNVQRPTHGRACPPL